MEKYQILVKCDRLGGIIEDWMRCGKCNLTLRVAKTDGCSVIETTDPLYAARIIKWLQAAERVNIIKDKPNITSS
jgi:hypothetical protein